jgi:hypothetical protein
MSCVRTETEERKRSTWDSHAKDSEFEEFSLRERKLEMK